MYSGLVSFVDCRVKRSCSWHVHLSTTCLYNVAMTAQASNPRDFKSWEDAFQYPVPVVRRLEQQLRGSINENREQLRRLVGTSYRDLLGTAERIIEMEKHMHNADELLGEIGQKCNARTIEKIVVNHARSTQTQRDRSARRNGLASTLAVLLNCMTISGRIIKRGGPSLLAAKLLVLARLLHSSAAKSQDPPPLLDTLRTRLTSLRRRVLNYIDKILAESKTERVVLIETLSAFSLATTSTPTDVLRHFLSTRAEALNDLLEEPSEQGLHSAFSLLLSTLREAQAVFPRRLADLLSRLQNEPLLQDGAVRSTADLNLDLYERWIAEDVQNFTPYLRHDQLKATQATKVIEAWAGTARQTVIEGLKKLLHSMKDAQKVTALRKDIISRSLSADRKLPGVDQATFFEDLRACFIEGLRRIASETTHEMTTVIDEALSADKSGTIVKAVDMWDPHNIELDLSKGAVDFRNLIINSSQTKDGRLQSLDKSLARWSSRMNALSATIKSMKEERWDDDFDLDLDDDLELSGPQDLLAKEDPRTLSDVVNEQKKEALSKIFERIGSLVADGSNAKYAFLLRLLREVLQHAGSSERSASAATKPPAQLLDALYKGLAREVLDRLPYEPSTNPIPFSRSPATTLWEGSPALPIQPSPACFRFLRETCKIMQQAGGDLWTINAVDALKLVLSDLVAKSVNNTVLKQRDEAGEVVSAQKPTNGDAETDADTEDIDGVAESREPVAASSTTDTVQQHRRLLQTLYDVLYLNKVLGLTSSLETTDLDKVLSELKDGSELEAQGIERLRKSSGEYYKRTYLLFGLLSA